MKTVLFASLVASAAAFAPAARFGSKTTALSAGAVESMPGAIDLRGKEFFFDPLKLSETYEPFLPFFREAELRHGRTAMLAVLGWIVADFIRVPGDAYSFESIPASKDAHEALVAGPLAQLLMWIGLFDLIITGPAISATMKGEREPGDFGIHTAKPSDPEKYKKYVHQELLHGRLAMIAIGGIATQAVLSGKGFPYF